MKTLLILRHAKANPDSSSGQDFDRPLTERGRRDAASVGRRLRARDPGPDAIVASPAVRVVETLAGLLEGSGSEVEPRLDPRLYNASRDALLEVIREVDERVERLLIVGHNPGLQELLLSLAEPDAEGLRRGAGASFPTAALAELGLVVDRWREVGPSTGRMVGLALPGDLDPPPPSRD